MTIQDLLELFEYEPSSGSLIWKAGRKKGKHAGTRSNGRLRVVVGGRYMQGHRLAYALSRGVKPRGEIRCKDGDYTNLRANNLEEINGTENSIRCRPF